MTYFTKTHLRTEQVAANETFPPMSGSLFMNFENSFHSWSMADCRSNDWSPDPSVNKFQTSTIFGQFELCLNTSSVTPENNCENLKNKKFFAGGLDLSFYVDIKIWFFFFIFSDLGILMKHLKVYDFQNFINIKLRFFHYYTHSGF